MKTMIARKSIFVTAGVVLMIVFSLPVINQHPNITPTPIKIADGTDPMPYPPHSSATLNLSGPVLVADGTDPMPYPPRLTLPVNVG
jgi:hypothetical protein